MPRVNTARLAGNVLLVSFGLLAVFHVLVMAGVVPMDKIWGGKFGDSPPNIPALETLALVVTALFALIVAAKMDYVKAGRFRRAAGVGVWVIFAFLVLNTIGNLASSVSLENLVFAPFTILLAVCALVLAVAK